MISKINDQFSLAFWCYDGYLQFGFIYDLEKKSKKRDINKTREQQLKEILDREEFADIFDGNSECDIEDNKDFDVWKSIDFAKIKSFDAIIKNTKY
jgi:hypothetical protein